MLVLCIRIGPGEPLLALDLVEEFRPVLADRFVLTLVNTGAVKPGDFEIRENGGVLLSDSGRKKVLTAWQKKKSDQILHPFLQEKISWGLVPYVQALLLARSLRVILMITRHLCGSKRCVAVCGGMR